MLHLSHNHPSLINFEQAFREAAGFDRLAVLLPLHADVPDVYLPCLGLLLGKSLSLEQDPPPDDPIALQAVSDSLLAAAKPTARWVPEVVSVLSLLVREGLRIAASGALESEGPGEAQDAVCLQLRMCMVVLRAFDTIICQHTEVHT